MQAGDVIVEVTNAPWLVLWGADCPEVVFYPNREGTAFMQVRVEEDE